MKRFQVENLNYSVFSGNGVKKILDDVSFELFPGKITGIWGPNGSGKSTTINSILSDFESSENAFSNGGVKVTGKITLDGKRIETLPGYKRAKFISKISQDNLENFGSKLTIKENFAVYYNKSKKERSFLKKAVSKKDFNEALKKLLSISPIPFENRLDEYAASFSGGEAEYFATLAAFISEPKLLLLDEHTKKLDLSRKSLIEKITADYIRNNNIYALWVTHDPQQIIKYIDQILWLKSGTILECTQLARPFDGNRLLEKLQKFQQE